MLFSPKYDFMENAGVVFLILSRWQKISGGQHHTLLLDEEGGVFAMGRKEYGRLGLGPSCDDQSSPQKLQGLPRCSDVSCGNVVSFAVTTEGEYSLASF